MTNDAKRGQRTRFWISIKLATTGEPKKKKNFLKFCEFSVSLPADSSPFQGASFPRLCSLSDENLALYIKIDKKLMSNFYSLCLMMRGNSGT